MTTMPVLQESRARVEGGGGVDDSHRPRCSCLPFCFWGARSAGAPASRRRRRRRLRLRLRLPWLALPWFSRKGGKQKGAGGGDGSGNKRRGARLLLLLTASLQPKKALASVVVSGGGGALLPAKVRTYAEADRAMAVHAHDLISSSRSVASSAPPSSSSRDHDTLIDRSGHGISWCA